MSCHLISWGWKARLFRLLDLLFQEQVPRKEMRAQWKNFNCTAKERTCFRRLKSASDLTTFWRSDQQSICYVAILEVIWEKAEEKKQQKTIQCRSSGLWERRLGVGVSMWKPSKCLKSMGFRKLQLIVIHDSLKKRPFKKDLQRPLDWSCSHTLPDFPDWQSSKRCPSSKRHTEASQHSPYLPLQASDVSDRSSANPQRCENWASQVQEHNLLIRTTHWWKYITPNKHTSLSVLGI